MKTGFMRASIRAMSRISVSFLAVLAAWAVSTACADPVKIMSFNSTKGGTYIEWQQTRIMQGLKPDVVALQEWIIAHDSPWGDENYAAWVQDAFGNNYEFYRGLGSGGSLSNVNGIVSRWPITSSGSWTDSVIPSPARYFDWAVIDLPDTDLDLQIVSIHLKAGDSQDDKNDRVTEATNIKALIETNFNLNHYIVVCGDMNTLTRDSEPALIAVFDSYLTTADGIPADRNGNSYTNINRNKAFDWIIPSQMLGSTITTLIVGSSSYSEGIVFDSRVFYPLSEVPPILITDTDPDINDHCPIMKAYEILPTPTPTPGLYHWPLFLEPNKRRFSTHDHINLTVTFQTCLTPSVPYIRITRPDGSRIYLERIPSEKRTRILSSGAARQFIAGGPWVLDFALQAYPVLDTDFTVSQRGTWKIEAALVDVYGQFVGSPDQLNLTVH